MIGTALGTVISLLLTGILAHNFGWQSIFYIEGLLCLIWCVGWWLMVEDTPDKQKLFISNEEKEYIQKSLNKSISKNSHVNISPFMTKQFLLFSVFFCNLFYFFFVFYFVFFCISKSRVISGCQCSLEKSYHITTVFGNFSRSLLQQCWMVHATH